MSEADLIRELQEQERKEQLSRLWRAYGRYLVGGVSVVLVIAAGYSYMQYSTLRSQEENALQFAQATELQTEGKQEEAAKIFLALSEEAGTGVAWASSLKRASLHEEKGEKNKAAEIYAALANNTAADAGLRDFAALQAAALAMGDSSVTGVDARALLTAAAQDGRPYAALAKEFLAVVDAKEGKTTEAETALNALRESATTAFSQRARVQELLAAQSIIPQKAE